jgi:Stress responsive A/B Barrel Domain
VIRRFEIYSLPAAPHDDAVGTLETVFGRCSQYIPDVLYSRVGRNLSDAPVDVVWEHAFASPEAYQRYMVHPYHASVLDRCLLADSPQRLVVDDVLGAGLVGYHCDAPVFELSRGLRRVLVLRLSRRASPEDVHRLTETLSDVASHADEMTLSVVGTNTLGSSWFDGVTPVSGPPRFTHLWEQGFTGVDGLDSYRHGSSAPARAERRGWSDWMGGIIERAVGLHYVIDDTSAPGIS